MQGGCLCLLACAVVLHPSPLDYIYIISHLWENVNSQVAQSFARKFVQNATEYTKRLVAQDHEPAKRGRLLALSLNFTFAELVADFLGKVVRVVGEFVEWAGSTRHIVGAFH